MVIVRNSSIIHYDFCEPLDFEQIILVFKYLLLYSFSFVRNIIRKTFIIIYAVTDYAGSKK